MGYGLADTIVLSDEEKAFLESQVRRHKAPGRCRSDARSSCFARRV